MIYMDDVIRGTLQLMEV
jgi:nucleoside-diphosphate-sugar epimerase